jgi:hypothetical protein
MMGSLMDQHHNATRRQSDGTKKHKFAIAVQLHNCLPSVTIGKEWKERKQPRSNIEVT